MNKLFTQWGFNSDSWRGKHGEYWVFVQGILMLIFVILPVWQIPLFGFQESKILLFISWGLAILFAVIAGVFLIKGVLDLGGSLTPLPYPREDGQLVKSGIYSKVRHPIYSGVLNAALGASIFQWSLSHLIATAILFVFFDAKAKNEEAWLTEKYPDYLDYSATVKKLIPWVY